MPPKLTKDELATLSKLTDDLTTKGAMIDQQVSIYNNQVEALRTPVEVAVTDFNNVVEEARQFCQSIATRVEDEITGKSESWQNSDAGQSAAEFRDSWDTIDLSDLDFAWPDELTIEVSELDTELDELPKEA